MSYTINKRSASKVRGVTRPGMYGDGAGLWLQGSNSGSNSWIFRYDFFGRRREMGLGSCNTVDLALAREKARACPPGAAGKRDPIEERDKARVEYVHQQAGQACELRRMRRSLYRGAPRQLEERQACSAVCYRRRLFSHGLAG
jgi:hypothetical protein